MAQATPLGVVSHLWRYPVKALRGEPLERSDVDGNGLTGDRASALFVDTPDRPRSGKTYRGKENRALHTVSDPRDAEALGRDAGLTLAVRAGGPHFDASPVSVLFDVWLADVERLAGMALEPLRFRPNLFVRAAASFVGAEASLVGALLAVGTVRLRVTGPTERCVTPSYDVHTGEPARRVLEALVRERENVAGVYCDVERAGTLAVGDAVVRVG